MLPTCNYDLLKYLMEFLETVSVSAATRMNARNLAVIFAPLLLRSAAQVAVADMIEDSTGVINIVELLIVHRAIVFEK